MASMHGFMNYEDNIFTSCICFDADSLLLSLGQLHPETQSPVCFPTFLHVGSDVGEHTVAIDTGGEVPST